MADLAPSPPGPLVPLLVTGSQGYQPSSPQRPGMKKHLPRRPAEQWGKTKRKQSLCPELCPARAPHPELCPAQAPHGQLAGAHCLLLSTFIHGQVEPRQDPVLHQGQNQVTLTKWCFRLNKDPLGFDSSFPDSVFGFPEPSRLQATDFALWCWKQVQWQKQGMIVYLAFQKTSNGHRYVLSSASGAEDMEVRRNPETVFKISF